jgi:hypothetical protein
MKKIVCLDMKQKIATSTSGDEYSFCYDTDIVIRDATISYLGNRVTIIGNRIE